MRQDKIMGGSKMREAPKTPRVFLLNENNQIQKNTFERRRIQKKSFHNSNTQFEKDVNENPCQR